MTPRVGDTFDGGAFRARITQCDASLFEIEATYRPGSKPPPAHYHPRQQERFQIQSGAMRFVLDGQERFVRAGEELLIEPGQVHLAHNASSSEEVVTLWQTRPAMKTPLLFATIAELNRRGRSLLDLPLMASTFREEFVLARPPRLVQDCVFGILAPLVRLLGHRLPAV
jgi:quercetin dioxygenase-like cupin family protein